MTGEDLIDIAGAFCEATLLHHAVVRWNLFELARAPLSAEEFAAARGLRTDKVEIMLDALAALGLLERTGDRWITSPLAAAHLIEGCPDDLRAYIAHLDRQRRHWLELEAVLAADAPLAWQQERVHVDPLAHAEFLQAMEQEARSSIAWIADLADWADRGHLLDVGGGHGAFAAALVKRYPALRATVLDRAASASVVAARAASEGLGTRLAFAPCDLTGDAPLAGLQGDAVLLANVLGNFSAPVIRRILEVAAAAAGSDGVLIVFGPVSSPLVALQLAIGIGDGWLPNEAFIDGELRRLGLNVRREPHGDDEVAWIARPT